MAEVRAHQRISLAILALGGQGGGVLSDWIQSAARIAGHAVQGTSVPGVAQRTGTTVYYLEIMPEAGSEPPFFALSPTPGDVHVVLASELMEAGRAMVRGFVTPDRTTLITSTHRIYAISEKGHLADGRAKSERVEEAAGRRAKRLIALDMEEAARESGSVISSVMLGALAESEALPIARGAFEQAIRQSGIAVEANLRGFAAGFARAGRTTPARQPPVPPAPRPTTRAGEALAQRVRVKVPTAAHELALRGVQRLVDYQDYDYADLYLRRLVRFRPVDDQNKGWLLTCEVARRLALWMSYEDVIRVADLKTRAARFNRVREEAEIGGAALRITEFFHPRLEEVADLLPPPIGRMLLERRGLARALRPLFRGRRVRTNGLVGYVGLRALAGLRRWRRRTLRYAEEQQRIEGWLGLVFETARGGDYPAAVELARCQQLVRGYGDTLARGWRNFSAIVDEFRAAPDACAADVIRGLREAALADEEGVVVAAALADRALARTGDQGQVPV